MPAPRHSLLRENPRVPSRIGPRTKEVFQMSSRNRSLITVSSVASDREEFDYRKADDFYQKSLSEHTRQAYRRSRILHRSPRCASGRHYAEAGAGLAGLAGQ